MAEYGPFPGFPPTAPPAALTPCEEAVSRHRARGPASTWPQRDADDFRRPGAAMVDTTAPPVLRMHARPNPGRPNRGAYRGKRHSIHEVPAVSNRQSRRPALLRPLRRAAHGAMSRMRLRQRPARPVLRRLRPGPRQQARRRTGPGCRARAERRQLTVMFCDLVGSTALSRTTGRRGSARRSACLPGLRSAGDRSTTKATSPSTWATDCSCTSATRGPKRTMPSAPCTPLSLCCTASTG